MKSLVVLQKAPDYDRERIEARMQELLAPLGGMEAFVRPGQKVLLKPNMLAGKSPEKAVTTHPEVVRAVIRLAQRAGGVVAVGDSPGVGSPLQVAERCGILQVVKETGASFAPFRESVRVRPPGRAFQELEVARDVLEAEVLINLPKLKTHQMMGMTCGVKNLFGAVVGMRKPRLHLQAGSDKGAFALMLLELAEFLKPALTVVDAVVAMEGDGPGSGDPVAAGFLLAGINPLAIDAVAARLLGLPAEEVWTLLVGRRTGRPGARLEEIELAGTPLAELAVPGFRPAKKTAVNFGLPLFLARPLRRSLSARPSVDPANCELCGLCLEHCPPKAMTISRGRLKIDPEACIECFCCQELCPKGALLTRQGLLLRLSRFIGG